MLVRFPLCPRATVPDAVLPRVGCAFRHDEDPVVEYLVCPIATCPTRDSRADSEKTCETSPMSL